MSRLTEVHRRCDICAEFVGIGEGASLPAPGYPGQAATWDACPRCMDKPISVLAEKVREHG